MYTGTTKKKKTATTGVLSVNGNTNTNNNKQTYTKQSLSQSHPNMYFSDADIDLMNSNSKAANGLISAKQSYLNATTDEARNQANNSAESIRRTYGSYSGGSDGSQYNPIYDPTDVEKPTYKKQGTKPTYTAPAAYNSKYTSTIDDLYDQIVNAKFEYDKNNDPQYQALAAMMSRQASNASNNALASARNGSGFASSTAAISAAQQGYNNQMAQLNDAIPQLYANAYNDFNTERENLYNALQTAMQRDSVDYSRYRDNVSDNLNEYNLAYNDYRNDVTDGLNDYSLAYNDYRNTIADNWDVLNHREDREDELYNRTQTEQATKAEREQAEIAAMLTQQQNNNQLALDLIDRYGYDIGNLLGLSGAYTMNYTKNDVNNYATKLGADTGWQNALTSAYNAETDRNYKYGTLQNEADKISNDLFINQAKIATEAEKTGLSDEQQGQVLIDVYNTLNTDGANGAMSKLTEYANKGLVTYDMAELLRKEISKFTIRSAPTGPKGYYQNAE